MKIVIDISSEDFEKVKCGRSAVSMMRRAIIDGTPLPEGVEILTKEAYSDLCTRVAEQPEKRTEERTETHACDCISREAARNALLYKGQQSKRYKLGETWELNLMEIEEALEELPSVEPGRKTGKWIHIVGFWECDQCHAKYMDMPTYVGKVIYEYCPMCGSKMEVDG